jgi:multidrug efflux pump subunit AcrA (membrane-fusion protein)
MLISDKIKGLLDFGQEHRRRSRRRILFLTFLAVGITAGLIYASQTNFKKIAPTGGKTVQAKQVRAVRLDAISNGEYLTSEGTVKAASRIDVVALANGTVRLISFKVGDKATLNQTLVSLSDDISMTNLTNAGNNLSNQQQNYSTTGQLTSQTIKQAQLGVDRASEAVKAAEIGLKSAQDNYDNSRDLQAKNLQDLESNAAVSYYNQLSTIGNALSQCNFIIKAEGDTQLEGIAPTLSVKNNHALTQARDDYVTTKRRYDDLVKRTTSAITAASDMRAAVDGLGLAKIVVDDTISVLENTISSATLGESALNGQRSTFAALRGTVIGAQTGAQIMMQSLENFDLVSKQQLDGLAAAKNIAANQLDQARIGYDNAVASLSASRKASDQQLTLSRSALDNAQGQYNLISNQAGDLTIKAPISGQLTAKTVEIGTEVRVGQKVAEISKTDSVKIVLWLSPSDAARVKLGEKTTINGKLEGSVNQIDPAADPTSKRVKVEVVFENSKKELTPETLATVALPLKKMEQEKNTFVLPLDAVTIAQNENYIFTIDGTDTARKVTVALESIEGEQATIKVDLPRDTSIVIEGNKLLEDGDKVEIMK